MGELGQPLSRRNLLLSLASLFPAGRLLRGAQEKTFSTEVNVVNVLATVRGKNGEVVRDLRKDNFILEEDGHPQAIRYFSQESNLPLTLGLLVDTSMSQRNVLGQERSASYRFLDQVLREEKDLAFLIHFDFEIELLQDLTSSRKLLERALASLQMPELRQANRGGFPGPGPRGRRGGGAGGAGGGTTLYDAVLLASDELMKRQAGRKALIILSDGVDTGSRVRIEEAIESAQRADTLAYSILFADEDAYRGGFGPGPRMGGRRGGRGGRIQFPSAHPDGKKILKRISQETGGGFFEVSKKHPIDEIYKNLEEELRNQYSLGYSPDRTDARTGYHKIHLTTTQKGLVVQARTGYYAD